MAELATWVGRAHYFDSNLPAATIWLNKALGHDKNLAEAHYVLGAALQAFNSNPTEETHDGLWNECAFDLDELRRGMGRRWGFT